LREYIGRQLGNLPNVRHRALKFTSTGLPVEEVISRIETIRDLISRVVSGLSTAGFDAVYPEQVLAAPLSARQFLLHLLGYFSYYLGQIDYLRRILTQGNEIPFAGL
jgi:hypothetical protein